MTDVSEIADQAIDDAEAACAAIDASNLPVAAKQCRKKAVWRQAEDFIDGLID